jgi:hypothetical protein
MEELEYVAVHRKDMPHDQPDETGKDHRRVKEEAVEEAAEAVPSAPPEENQLERQRVEQLEKATPPLVCDDEAAVADDVQLEERRASLPNRHETRSATRMSLHRDAVETNSHFRNLKLRLVAHDPMQEWTDNGEIVSRKPARDMAADKLMRQLQSVSFRYPRDIRVNYAPEDETVIWSGVFTNKECVIIY